MRRWIQYKSPHRHNMGDVICPSDSWIDMDFERITPENKNTLLYCQHPDRIIPIPHIYLLQLLVMIQKTTEPNQAVEPTIIAVTDRAQSSTLRASHDRGSL